MRPKSLKPEALALFLAISVVPGHAQKAGDYIRDMAADLPSSASVEAPTCHDVEITPATSLTRFVIATGKNGEGDLLWTVYAVDALRFSFDMANLNEDGIRIDRVMSLASFSQHRKGDPYPDPDLVVVAIPAIAAATITVHAVDLDKLNALSTQAPITEGDMGVRTEQRRAVLVAFSGADRAEAFVNTLKKAIIACKAQ